MHLHLLAHHSVYRFRYGDPGSLPPAAMPVLEGMRVGGRRRVLVPPEAGWVDDLVRWLFLCPGVDRGLVREGACWVKGISFEQQLCMEGCDY